MRRWKAGLVFFAATAMLVCVALAGTCKSDEAFTADGQAVSNHPAVGLEACIAATCRVRAKDGGVGTGFLYAVGPEKSGGEDLAWIGTAGHVIVGEQFTCEFGRPGVRVQVRPYWRSRGIDAGVLVVPYRVFPAPRPRPVPVAPPRIRIQIGQPLFSVGCPGGGPLMLWRGECKGYFGQSMQFWPGPELGRSGSPIFCYLAEGQPAVVGIVSARDSGGLGPQTTGIAVSVQQLVGGREAAQPPWTWRPTQCPPGQICPQPGAGDLFNEGYHLSPYRQQQQKRNEYLYRQSQERSQGTLPLPPERELVPIPPDPMVNQRLSNLELKVSEHDQRLNTIRDTAKELAEKYDPQLQGIKGDVDKAIEASGQAAGAAKTAASVAETAKAEAVGATEKVAVVEEETKGIKGKLALFIDEGGGPIKQKIQEKLEDRGMSSTVAGLVGALGGSAVVGGIIALVVFLVRRGEKKAMAGEDTLLQRFAERTPWSWDDKVADIEARVLRRVGERLHPSWGQSVPANPTQPQ